MTIPLDQCRTQERNQHHDMEYEYDQHWNGENREIGRGVTRQRKTAPAAEPSDQSQAPGISRPTSNSTNGYRSAIGVWQSRQRPRRISQLIMGMLSNQRMGCRQTGHRDPLRAIPIPAGTRNTTTFRKLPYAAAHGEQPHRQERLRSTSGICRSRSFVTQKQTTPSSYTI